MIDAIRQTALTLSALFIVIAVLETVIPQKTMPLVIRWVVLMFIVVSLFEPISSLDTQELFDGFTIPEQPEFDSAQELLLGEAERTLETQIMAALLASDVTVNDVRVEFAQNSLGLGIDTIYIEGGSMGNRLRTEQIVGAVTDMSPYIIYE